MSTTGTDSILNDAVVVQEPTPHHVRFNPPSRCVFYPKNVLSIYVRRFDLADINALSSSKNAADLAGMIRAIGRTINIPIEILTQYDFKALCFWHRVNSFPRKPLQINYECPNIHHALKTKMEITPDMSQDEQDDIKDAKQFFKNRYVLNGLKDLNGSQFTEERYEKLIEFYRDKERYSYPHVLLPATVGSMIEFTELAKLQMRNAKLQELDLNDQNLETVLDELVSVTSDDIIVRLANHMPLSFGATLLERMTNIKKAIETNPDKFGTEFLDDLDMFDELVDHELSETVKTKCKYGGCEHAIELNLEFDLFGFFPHV